MIASVLKLPQAIYVSLFLDLFGVVFTILLPFQFLSVLPSLFPVSRLTLHFKPVFAMPFLGIDELKSSLAR